MIVYKLDKKGVVIKLKECIECPFDIVNNNGSIWLVSKNKLSVDSTTTYKRSQYSIKDDQSFESRPPITQTNIDDVPM